MEYKEERIIDTLLVLIQNELIYEDEYNNCETKDYIDALISAKKWLLKKKKVMPIVLNSIIEEDIEKYLDK